MKYRDRIKLPGDTTLDLLDEILEELAGYGEPELAVDTKTITFTIEAVDLWELRGTLDELADSLDASQIDWEPNRDRILP